MQDQSYIMSTSKCLIRQLLKVIVNHCVICKTSRIVINYKDILLKTVQLQRSIYILWPFIRNFFSF